MSEPTWNIPLPDGAQAPIEVYVNSVKIDPSVYSVDGRWVKVRQKINPKQQLSFGRRILLGMGVGVYGDLKADQVDVSYQLGGRTQFSTDVTIIPPPTATQPSG